MRPILPLVLVAATLTVCAEDPPPPAAPVGGAAPPERAEPGPLVPDRFGHEVDLDRPLRGDVRVTPARPGFRHVFRLDDPAWPRGYAFPDDR